MSHNTKKTKNSQLSGSSAAPVVEMIFGGMSENLEGFSARRRRAIVNEHQSLHLDCQKLFEERIEALRIACFEPVLLDERVPGLLVQIPHDPGVCC